MKNWNPVKQEDVPADMKLAAATDKCNTNFHVWPGTAKPGDLCKCDKEVFLPELLKH